MPGRAIRTPFLQRVEGGTEHPGCCPFHCIRTCDSKTSPYCIALALYHAYKGNFEKGFAFAGSNAFRVERIVTVKEMMKEFIGEYQQVCELIESETSVKKI